MFREPGFLPEEPKAEGLVPARSCPLVIASCFLIESDTLTFEALIVEAVPS